MKRRMTKAQKLAYIKFTEMFAKERDEHGHPFAALACLGFNFTEDIDRLMDWLAINSPSIYQELQEVRLSSKPALGV